MALFMIERNLAEEMELSPELLATIDEYNGNANLRWLFSFLSADRKKTYCLYEAPDADALRPPGGRPRLPGGRDHGGRRGQPGDVRQRRLRQRLPRPFLTRRWPLARSGQKAGWRGSWPSITRAAAQRSAWNDSDGGADRVDVPRGPLDGVAGGVDRRRGHGEEPADQLAASGRRSGTASTRSGRGAPRAGAHRPRPRPRPPRGSSR